MIDLSDDGDNDCLTRAGGLFVWDEDVLRKLDGCKISGADSLQAKQKRLALCMIEFTYVLMMSQNGRIAHTSFTPFMGRSVTLHKNRDT